MYSADSVLHFCIMWRLWKWQIKIKKGQKLKQLTRLFIPSMGQASKTLIFIRLLLNSSLLSFSNSCFLICMKHFLTGQSSCTATEDVTQLFLTGWSVLSVKSYVILMRKKYKSKAALQQQCHFCCGFLTVNVYFRFLLICGKKIQQLFGSSNYAG